MGELLGCLCRCTCSKQEEGKSLFFFGPLHSAETLSCKDWSAFLSSHGVFSWQSIGNTFWRRQVGLRFMLTLLQLAPLAYKVSYPSYSLASMKDRFLHQEEQNVFLKMLMESLIEPNVTIEHSFVSQLFLVDGLRHVLLHGISQICPAGKSQLKFTLEEFLASRLEILRSKSVFHLSLGQIIVAFHLVIMSNLSTILQQNFNTESETTAKLHVQFVVDMLSTMKYNYEVCMSLNILMLALTDL